MSVDSSIDLELHLKKRARRRLVGAIALVLLMVVILPMMLRDRSAEQPKQEVAITIPNEISNNGALVNAAPVVVSLSSQLPSTVADKPVEKKDDLKPIAETATANDNSQVNSIVSNISVTPPAELHSITETKKIVPKAIDEPKKQVAAELKKPETTALNTKFYVQIGVFSDADNVKKLQAQLASLGYKSQTETISTDKGDKIRLRTSTFNSRDDAATALDKIKSSNMAGIVVSQK